MRRIDVLSLYTNDMSFYGDMGNVLVISKRLAFYGFEPVVHFYNPGDSFPDHVDMVLGGGGQDSGQKNIFGDLQKRSEKLRALASSGVPMLMICGMYQLFGRYFLTNSGKKIPGISVFDIYTEATSDRLIGNLVEESDRFGRLVGYENHSGQTYFSTPLQPLGKVVSGAGNNLKDGVDGAIVNNAIGTYLHGPVLSKNPKLADFLIEKAQLNRYGEARLPSPSPLLGRIDELAAKANEAASRRPR
ncbi:MAG: glutamine amidotransferase [Aeriscardovia sp.]|nr:glutamine amidotransferase [Aeriscardovia sp.]